MHRSIGKQSTGNPQSQSWRRKRRLQWEGFVEKEVNLICSRVCAFQTYRYGNSFSDTAIYCKNKHFKDCGKTFHV